MRQSGVVAAAALEGLRKQLPRIGEDHVNAKRFAQVRSAEVSSGQSEVCFLRHSVGRAWRALWVGGCVYPCRSVYAFSFRKSPEVCT